MLFGVIALRWYDTETWQSLAQIWKLPGGRMIGGGMMVAQIAGGLAIQHVRSARWGATILAAVYLLFCLVCLPSGNWASFFEQVCLFSGALALYAATGVSGRSRVWAGRLARLGLGVSALSFMRTQIVYFHETAAMVPRWIPGQTFWAVVTTAAFGLAGIAILLNRRAGAAAGLMAAMVALFGVLVWIPRLAARPAAHFAWSEFALTMLIAGAAFLVWELRAGSQNWI